MHTVTNLDVEADQKIFLSVSRDLTSNAEVCSIPYWFDMTKDQVISSFTRVNLQ
jgi:hypothetical protein